MPTFISKKKKRNIKPKQRHILMHRYYPIGHATGLTEKEWQEFADNYTSKS